MVASLNGAYIHSFYPAAIARFKDVRSWDEGRRPIGEITEELNRFNTELVKYLGKFIQTEFSGLEFVNSNRSLVIGASDKVDGDYRSDRQIARYRNQLPEGLRDNGISKIVITEVPDRIHRMQSQFQVQVSNSSDKSALAYSFHGDKLGADINATNLSFFQIQDQDTNYIQGSASSLLVVTNKDNEVPTYAPPPSTDPQTRIRRRPDAASQHFRALSQAYGWNQHFITNAA